MSRGPGTWQREILRTTSGVCVVTVGSIVRARLPSPARPAFVAARSAAKGLALDGRIVASYAHACQRCAIQDDREPGDVLRAGPGLSGCLPAGKGACLARASSRGPDARMGKRCGGTAPRRADSHAGSRRPGQPGHAELWERMEAGTITISVPDAVALARLAHDQEHDRALAERDEAVRERDEALRQIHDAAPLIEQAVRALNVT